MRAPGARTFLIYLAGLFALPVAYLAQLLLVYRNRPEAAAWLYAAAGAVLLVALALDRARGDTAPATAPPLPPAHVTFGPRRLVGVVAVASLVCVTAAAVLDRDLRSGVGLFLWLASLVILVAGSRVDQDPSSALIAAPDEDLWNRGRPRPSPLVEALLVVALLALAVSFRVYLLETHPGIHGDEGEQGIATRDVVEGRGPGVFGYSWGGLPAFFFYSMAPFVRLFGESMIATRSFSVLCGLAAVLLVYGLGRRMWGVRTGLLAGGLLATLPVALEFSRVALASTATGTLWAAGFLFLSRALSAKKASAWPAAGVWFGLSFYFYPAGRLIVVAVALLLAYTVARRKWRLLAGWGLLLLALALTLVPQQVASRADGWGAFMQRALETSVLSPQNRALVFASHGIELGAEAPEQSLLDSVRARPLDWLRVGLGQAKRTVEVFYRHGDPTFFYSISEHGGSLLSPLLAALTVLGVLGSLWLVRDGRHALVLAWLVAGLLPAAVTINTPSVQRLTAALPVLVLFPATLLDRILASVWPALPRLARAGGSVLCALVLAVVGTAGWHEYFDHYRARCPHCDGTAQARYVERLGTGYRAYVLGVGEANIFFEHGSTRYLGGSVEGYDATVLSEVLPITGDAAKGAAFLVYPYNLQYLPLIQLLYPEGEREDVALQDGIVRFVGYRVTPAQVAAERVLEAHYEGADGVRHERFEGDFGAATWSPPAGLAYPAKASWRGAILARRYGVYRFALEGSTTELSLDGERVAPLGRGEGAGGKGGASAPAGPAELVLARGLHDARIDAVLENAQAAPAVRWAFGSGVPEPIESAAVYRRSMGGLSGEIWMGPGLSLASLPALEGVAPAMRRIDPFVAFRWLIDVTGPQPLVARWHGSIRAPSPGATVFEVKSGGPARLLIDDRPVIELAGAGIESGTAELGAGLHDVEIDYAWESGRSELEWYWTPPGGARELVPPAALVPAARSWRRGEIPDPIVSADAIAAPAMPGLRPALVLPDSGRLAEPRGVGVDGGGRVFIGDTGNHRMVRLEDGGPVVSWGSGADREPRRFGLITDLAVTADGRVATVDGETGDVTRFDADGTVDLHLPRATSSASGIAIEEGGRIWVADTGMSRIVRIEATGEVSTWTGEGGELERLEQPLDVVVDAGGVAYAIDLRRRVVRFDAEGRIDAEWKMDIGRLRGGSHLARLGDRIVMTHPDRGQLIVLDPSSGEARSIDDIGRVPVGVAVGADGRVYVVDSDGAVVNVYDSLDPGGG